MTLDGWDFAIVQRKHKKCRVIILTGCVVTKLLQTPA